MAVARPLPQSQPQTPCAATLLAPMRLPSNSVRQPCLTWPTAARFCWTLPPLQGCGGEAMQGMLGSTATHCGRRPPSNALHNPLAPLRPSSRRSRPPLHLPDQRPPGARRRGPPRLQRPAAALPGPRRRVPVSVCEHGGQEWKGRPAGAGARSTIPGARASMQGQMCVCMHACMHACRHKHACIG